MWRWALVLVIVIGMVAGIAAGVLNPQSLTFDLLFVRFEAALGVLVIGAFVCGAILGAVVAMLFGMTSRLRSPTTPPGPRSDKALSPRHE